MKKMLLAIFVILIGMQFITVKRTNPSVLGEINAPENISNILKTSCYDCHSNDTNWPWYSYIAPVSFFVVSDVNEGRKRLNFSEWNNYDAKKKKKKKDGILLVLEDGEMPLLSYTFIHSEAKLDSIKIGLLKAWAIESSSDEKPLRYHEEKENE